MNQELMPPPAARVSVRPFRVLTGAELFQMPQNPTEWLVEGLFPAVGTSLVGAAPKVGKSVLTRQLCAFAQIGIPFLGRDVKAGNALYFSTQERAGPIVDHFRSLGCTEETMPAVIAGERFDPRDAMVRLAQTVATMPDLKLVVLDMIGEFLPLKDGNDYQEMLEKFAPLRRLADEHKLHLCVTTHTKKVQTENPVHAVIGSQAIAGAVDQVVILNNDAKQQRTITTVQRYGESLPLTLLNWDHERRAMFLGEDVEEVRAEQKKATADRIIQEIFNQILMYPGRTRDEVLAAVTGNTGARRDAFNRIYADGHLTRSGTGEKGNPYTYTLADKPSNSTAVAA